MAIPTRLQSTLRRERVNGKLTPWGKFAQHRRDAKGRGIVFALTFEQWCGIWERSGKWNKRGARRGQYVMARDGDRGPYAIGNVRILPCEQNHSDANKGVSRPHSIEHGHAISRAKLAQNLKLSKAHKKRIGDGVRAAFAQRPLADRRRHGNSN